MFKNFKLKEFIESETATKLGIDNTPDFDEVLCLYELVKNVVQPLRTWYGKSISIKSGYRCLKLNEAVGGVSTSQHTKGKAVDISVGTKEGNKKLFDFICANLKFDQVIDEQDYTWVHVSWDSSETNRNQILHLK